MRALITGINGQDGSYLAELLLAKGYEVHGTIRRSSLPNAQRLSGFQERLVLHYGDLTDASGMARVIAGIRPDEVYNLAALSDVRVSFDTAEYSGNATGLGVTRLLELVPRPRTARAVLPGGFLRDVRSQPQRPHRRKPTRSIPVRPTQWRRSTRTT
jgi:GDP-mannose 4,6-dehydratase